MYYKVPDYYKEFACIADDCSNTCCGGWEIVIDDEMLEKYKLCTDPYLKQLFEERVDFKKGTFRQKDGRCAMLDKHGLCEIYKHTQSEEYWCDTCSLYPRHIEEFEGVREISLGLSCPEVCRILTEKKEPVTFQHWEDDEDEFYEDFDYLFYTRLDDAREVMIRIAQDRTISLELRVEQLLMFARDLQRQFDEDAGFDMDDTIGFYRDHPDSVELLPDSEDAAYRRSVQYFSVLDSLEVLFRENSIKREELKKILFFEGKSSYTKIRRHFEECFPGELDIPLEQIMVYFLFVYFNGAVYDGLIYARVQLAVMSVYVIRDLFSASTVKNQDQLSMQDFQKIVIAYCREVEHSDENLDRIEELLS